MQVRVEVVGVPEAMASLVQASHHSDPVSAAIATIIRLRSMFRKPEGVE
jgi:hypothetical protein